jgi:hypothetical protein
MCNYVLYRYVYMNVCTYVCMFLCMYIYVYMYVYNVRMYVGIHDFCSFSKKYRFSFPNICNFITDLHNATNWASAESHCSCCTVLSCYSMSNEQTVTANLLTTFISILYCYT